MKWLWRLLEARVDAAITSRIVAFHSAMVRRGQIKAASDPLPDRY